MRSALFGLAASIFLALGASWCRADGLLYQLPEDGSWVQFRATISMMPPAEAGAAAPAAKMMATMKMSSVGQQTVEGDKCRWIEIELIPDKPQGAPPAPEAVPMGPPHMIAKLLLSEKDLHKGGEPLKHFVKGWQKEGDREPGEIKDPNSESTGPIPAFLSGPLKDVKELDKKTVDTKLGQLECSGITGNQDYKQGQSMTNVKFETWLNDKAPFGVVNSTMHYETKHGEQGQAEKGGVLLELQDAGKDAKSSLPDKS